MAKVTFGIRDFSQEGSSVSFNLATPTDTTSLTALSAERIALQIGLVGITIGQVNSRSTLLDVINLGNPPASDPVAQRELKVLFRCKDTATGLPANISVPTPDISVLGLNAGSDVCDLTGTEMAAFVAAVNSFALSNIGNPLEVQSARLVGRNL